jgi:hypothetical protein
MKHLLILFLLLIAASICHATSNVTFSGGGYDISVLLSDEDCKAESDCRKKTIHLVVPETKSHPYFELKSTSKRSHITVGDKKVKVSPDWQM